MTLRTLEGLGDAAGARVFVRVDFNVPLSGGQITDDSRIMATLPTVQELLDRQALPVLASHLGRPRGQTRDDLRLAPVADRLARLLPGVGVVALGHPGDPETIGGVGNLRPGEVALLENLRFDPGEEANDIAFAGQLANLADAYVDDAFGAAHRAHASVSALPELMIASGRPAVAGRLLQKEVEVLGQLLHGAERPYCAILGGAKVSDKLGVIGALVDRVDSLLVGGAMAFTLLLAQRASVGASMIEADRVLEVTQVLQEAAERGVRVILPSDVVAAPEVSDSAPARVVPAHDIPGGLMGLDIGPATVESFASVISDARTILWNGPMGVFELEPFSAGTRGVADAVARSEAFSVVGGGDSLAAVRQAGLEASFDHLSTGGGASLEFLEGKALPGIEILEDPN